LLTEARQSCNDNIIGPPNARRQEFIQLVGGDDAWSFAAHARFALEDYGGPCLGREVYAMDGTRSLALATTILLFVTSPTFAGPCKHSIDELQARVDAAIGSQAAADPSRAENLRALRNYQPTPRSLAASEGAAGKRFQAVLKALKRARSADRAGQLDRCNALLDKARSALDPL
jgi:hypothetical protein